MPEESKDERYIVISRELLDLLDWYHDHATNDVSLGFARYMKKQGMLDKIIQFIARETKP